MAVPPEELKHGEHPGPERLAELCRRHGIDLDPVQVERLWAFHCLLRERDRDLNLTRIHNFESMVVKHYVDSMLPARLLELPSPLLDIGSGAGFPAVPIKILRPELRLILAEGRKRRAAFLEEVAALLGMEGIEVVARKIGPSFQQPVGGVITRAVEAAEETLERVRPFLPSGGRVILMKGPGCEAELLRARHRFEGIFTLEEDRAYVIPGTPHRRRLLVFRRLRGQAVSTAAATCAAVPFHGRVRTCTSTRNRSFLFLRKLLTARGIRKEGRAILAGRRLTAEMLRDHGDRCRGWISSSEGPPPPPEAPEGLTWYRMTPELFRALDVHGTGSPLLLVEVAPFPPFRPQDPWPKGCTLFLPFQDPENMGAAIRSAAGLGAARVVLLREGAHPFLPRAARAAGPGLFKVPMLSGPSLRELAPGPVPILALAAGGRDLSTYTFPERFGLVAGLEGPGLPPGFPASETLAVPMERGVESLNAAAAVAVALYARRVQAQGQASR